MVCVVAQNVRLVIVVLMVLKVLATGVTTVLQTPRLVYHVLLVTMVVVAHHHHVCHVLLAFIQYLVNRNVLTNVLLDTML